MSMPEEGHQPIAEAGFMPGPGHLLRSAREAAGLTVRDVSARMRLDEPLLEHLEADRFDLLPAPTFVRGYLRGYARLLDVPVEPVIEAYNRQGFEPPALVADIAERPQARSSDWTMQLVTVLVILLVVTSVVLWWQNQYRSGVDDLSPSELSEADGPIGAPGEGLPLLPPPSESDEPNNESATAESTPGSGAVLLPPIARGPAEGRAAAPPPVAAAPGGLESPVPLPSPSSPAPATTPGLGDTPTTSSGAAPGTTGPGAGAQGATGPGAGAPSAGSSSGSTGTSPATTADSGNASGSGSVGESGSTQIPGQGTVRFDFNRDSWLEVYDSAGKRLFYSIAKPGREYRFQGSAPLRIIVGRPETATVRYNGEPVDLSAYIGSGVARLTLRN